jgi:CheY-like chemotaxis protein
MGECRENFCAVSQIITRYTLAENNRRDVQILLAEDYPSSQKAVMQHLQSAGCRVDLASDGREALAAARLKQYDLIFMDVQMPEMDGFEATAGIRAHETKISTPGNAVHVPIIAMTAHAMKGYRELCLERGMDDYIAKPARKKDVIAMVETWTGNGTLCHLCHIPAMTQSSDVDSPPERAAPMDYDRALDEYDGNQDFLMELVSGFLKKANQQVETIRQSLANGNTETVMKEAHAMKGGAGLLTAVAVSGVALELETIGKSGNLSVGAEVLTRLEHELQRLAEFISFVIGERL